MEHLNKNKKWISFIELPFAIICAIVLFPIGFLYSIIILPFIYHRQSGKVYKYFSNLIFSIWFLITHLFHSIAFIIDVLGNVIVGELIEILIAKKTFLRKINGKTWFGNKNHSVSQSIGMLQAQNALNTFGVKLRRFVDFLFGEKHCILAYEYYLKIEEKNGRN